MDNLEKYVSLNPYFADIVTFLKENDLNALENGKHLIKDKDLFVNVMTTKGKTKEEAAFETHKNMLDIQIPLDNNETHGYVPLEALPAAEYNAEKDVTKYPAQPAETYVCLKPGEFVIFWPQDGHQPCIGEGDIHKAVFKVRV